MDERRSRPSSDVTVVYLELDGPRRDDPRTWDDLMAATVRRLRGGLRRGDSVGRYGDGILTLLTGVRAELGERVARRLVRSLDREPVEIARGSFQLAAEAVVEQVAPGERLDDAADRARSS